MKKQDLTQDHLKKIAEKLRKIRIERGYTSFENFAYENDIPRIQYWRIEKGENFTIKYLLRLLEIHKVSPEDFFKGIK